MLRPPRWLLINYEGRPGWWQCTGCGERRVLGSQVPMAVVVDYTTQPIGAPS